jgi:hypothetical protein
MLRDEARPFETKIFSRDQDSRRELTDDTPPVDIYKPKQWIIIHATSPAPHKYKDWSKYDVPRLAITASVLSWSNIC